jgi:hypothetical protein
MSLVWALIILENEICNKYFDIVKLDDYNRPQLIKALDYGVRGVINPLGLYVNEKEDNFNSPMPVVINSEETLNGDIDELKGQGWFFPNEGSK